MKAGDLRNPYPGPVPFDAGQKDVFFGRPYETSQLSSLIVAHETVLLYAQSGAGKTSLLNAGVIPVLLQEGLQVLPTATVRGLVPPSIKLEDVPNVYVFHTLLSWAESTDKPEELARLRLTEFLRSHRRVPGSVSRPIARVLIFDQFEELFTAYPQRWSDREDFFKEVAEALANDHLLRVVFGMREEYLARVDAFASILPDRLETRFLLERLTADAALDAIVKPTVNTPRHYAKDVPEKLVADLLKTRVAVDEPNAAEVVGEYVEPVQLQVVCRGLWSDLPPEVREITAEHLKTFGDVTEALSDFYEVALRDATSQAEIREGELRQWFEDALITPAKTRGTVYRGPHCTGGISNLAVDILDAKHVIRSESRAGAAWYELTHDRFIEPILKSNLQWRESHGLANRMRQRLEAKAAAWEQGAGDDYLLAKSELAEANAWAASAEAAELGITVNVRAYVAASKRAEDQRAREAREREERQERELRQVQELAAERQSRIEQQQRAAFWLRCGLAAMAVLVITLGVVAVWIAQTNKKMSEKEKQLNAANLKLNATILKLNATNQELKAANQELVSAKNLAVSEKNVAVASDKEMRLEALRVRDMTLSSQSSLIYLSNNLLQHASPQQSPQWLAVKGRATFSLGNYDSAQELFSEVLQSDPDNSDIRTERGYLALLQRRPEDALRDFGYIYEHLDRTSPLNNLNLTIAYAALGNYSAAKARLYEAIESLPHKEFEGGSELEIPPEITRATGRVTLDARRETFQAALYYMRANLAAYVGDSRSFQRALGDADQRAQRMPLASQTDAYLIAMTWAWLQLRIRCPNSAANCRDYGALASQAELWHRATYEEWAACYYEKFQEENSKHRGTKRYAAFASWVQQRQATLHTPSSGACGGLAERAPDVPTLEMEAREAEARENFQQANEFLDQALARAVAPEKLRLLLQKARVLFSLSYAENQSSDAQVAQIKRFDDQLEALKEELQKDVELRVKLTGKDRKEIEREVGDEYETRMNSANKGKNEAQVAKGQHHRNATKALNDLKEVCNQIIKHNQKLTTAYYYRALAQDWLDPSSERSKTQYMKDIMRALQLDPNNTDALAFLDDLVPYGRPDEASYLERYGKFLDFYHKISPDTADTLEHQARLAREHKQDLDALRSLDMAITMQPENLTLYELRAEAERAVGIDETQVKRNLAAGYRQAGTTLSLSGKLGKASDAYQKAWQIDAELARNNAGDEIRCAPDLAACSITRAVLQHSEWIFSAVVGAGQRSGAFMEAVINRGGKHGIVMGSQGDVYSRKSNTDGHERRIKKIGKVEVVSVEPYRAIVRIEMESPEGDGLVRKDDIVQLKALTPSLPDRSQLWSIAKYNLTFLALDGQKIFDYQTLYSDETQELDAKLREHMLENIHLAGQRYRDYLDKDWMKGKPLQEGTFAKQTLSQAMESTNLVELNAFLDFLAKNPREAVGQQSRVWALYAAWVSLGAPAE